MPILKVCNLKNGHHWIGGQSMLFLQRKAIFCLVVLILLPVQAFPAMSSNGSDGEFNPESDMVLDLPEDGVFNFTSIFIDSDVAITFNPNVANTPVCLLATEDIIINGSINISNFFNGIGGDLVISTAGAIQIGGSILANGSPYGGYGGTITIQSGTIISLEDNSHISVVGGEATGAVSNSGSVTLTSGLGNLAIDATYEGLTFDGVVNGGIYLGSGDHLDLELVNPLPVPSTMALLAFGIIGLVGLARRQRSAEWSATPAPHTI